MLFVEDPWEELTERFACFGVADITPIDIVDDVS
jgi:hypothetical protein